MILTLKQQRIIQELARYKYLTVSQFLRLGVDKHRSNLSTAFKRLTEGKRPLVKALKFGLIPTKGRVEALYYLTKWGAELVENAKYPRSRTVTLTSDYFHRVATVDCEIALYQSDVIQSVTFSHRYFDHLGSNRTHDRKVLTALPVQDGKPIIADWIFKIHTSVQQELYCGEVYMDGKDSARPYQSLIAYTQALHEGTINTEFDFQQGTRILAIFASEQVMKRVQERMSVNEEFVGFEAHFLFKSLKDLYSCNFEAGWRHFDDPSVCQMW